MAMEDEDNNAAASAKQKGGDVGDDGACIDRQPDAVAHRAGLNPTAGRGSRSGPGSHAATGIRVLKASHSQRRYFCFHAGGDFKTATGANVRLCVVLHGECFFLIFYFLQFVIQTGQSA